MRTARFRVPWWTSWAPCTAFWRCAICPSMSEEIKKIREEIDRLDEELVATLNKRAALAQKIGSLKGGGAAYRPERETEILRKVSGQKGILSGERVSAIFREIMSACRGLEEAIKVSYL